MGALVEGAQGYGNPLTWVPQKWTTIAIALFQALKIQCDNVLATQTRQPPTRDNARTSYQNQNQNIKMLIYYTTTMSSTTPKSLSLSKEDRMQIVL